MPFLVLGIGSLALGAYGAHKAAKASEKAGEQQLEASDKALALQERMYQQQRADALPAMNRANQAGNLLSGLMGIPTGPLPGPTGVPDNIGPPPGAIPDQYGRGFGLLRPGVTPEQALDPNFQYNPAMAQGQPTGQPRSAPDGQSAPQNSSGYVMMESPDGERQAVPREQADFYQAHGARTV